jgi:hypothetical protein
MAATVVFEFLFMHYAAGHPWDRLLAEYELWNGRLWTLVLASLVAWPLGIQSLRSAASDKIATCRSGLFRQ